MLVIITPILLDFLVPVRVVPARGSLPDNDNWLSAKVTFQSLFFVAGIPAKAFILAVFPVNGFWDHGTSYSHIGTGNRALMTGDYRFQLQ